MSAVETVFVGKRVVTEGTVKPAAIFVRAGIITKVGPLDLVPPGAPVVDAGDAVILPGVVDTHVHINEPGRTEWEGFATATRAAAAGGVTTVVDMPLNSLPPTVSVEAMLAKAEALHGQSVVDVGLWGGAVPGNDGVLRDLLREGALGFKAFLVDSGVPEFPPLDAPGLEAALRALAGTNAPLLVHAELPGPIEAARASVRDDDRTYLGYLRSRPAAAEDEAITCLAEAVARTGARAHVVHLSSASALPILARARDAGLPLSAETTPHYLSFDAESIPDGATVYKCAPPIREAANRRALWAGLADGLVELVVTDHSPCTPALKKLDEGLFASAWGGIASLQLGLAAVWTEARARGFGLADLARWTATAPAALAGLAGKKGRIAEGHDADLVFFDPDATFAVTSDLVRHRHKETPYAGRHLTGVAVRTYLRGTCVHGPADLVSARPSGRWLRGRM